MKKSTFFWFLFLAVPALQAQNYLISFTGSGDTTAVSTVKVDNLTSGASVTLNGTDILHLIHSAGISTPEPKSSAMEIYPNPMADETMLTFIKQESGPTTICLVDLSGKTVYRLNTDLSAGTQYFRISGLKQGMYFVNVSDENHQYSTKLISQDKHQNEPLIEYVSSSGKITGQPLKSVGSTIDMLYTNGDLLTYKGMAGQYSTVITDIPTATKTITFDFVQCTDSEGHHYATVRVGNGDRDYQVWMAENLNVGTMIKDTISQTGNGITEKYCYENLESRCDIYGALYQWGEMMNYDTTSGIQGICPWGWHIPTDAEWTRLTGYFGGDSVAGGKLKETGTAHWASPNTAATNVSGFTALPGGYRYYSGTLFITDYAVFWTSSQNSSTDAWYRNLYFNYEYVYRRAYTKENGYSIRCLKD